MEDWERRSFEQRIGKLETELHKVKLELGTQEFKRKLAESDRKFEDSQRKFRRGLIPMVAAVVFAIALPKFVVVSRLAAGG